MEETNEDKCLRVCKEFEQILIRENLAGLAIVQAQNCGHHIVNIGPTWSAAQHKPDDNEYILISTKDQEKVATLCGLLASNATILDKIKEGMISVLVSIEDESGIQTATVTKQTKPHEQKATPDSEQ